MDLYDGELRAIDSVGESIFEHVSPTRYRDYLIEEVRPRSCLKFPHIRSLGREHGWYRVGPLAQINCCASIDTPLAEAARREFIVENGGAPVQATLAYHWARLICLIHCAEKIKELLFDGDLQGSDLMARVRRTARRRNSLPRGPARHAHPPLHDRRERQVTGANLIVSTTNNNEAMNRAVKPVAISDLSGREITEGLLNHIEVAIRAFDPCLSCATHALGQMPLIVALEDADGVPIAMRTKE